MSKKSFDLKGNIFEQIIKETVKEAIDYAQSCEKLVCDICDSKYALKTICKCCIDEMQE